MADQYYHYHIPGSRDAVDFSPSDSIAAASLDISFSLPLTHRVRFTQDVFGADAEVLIDLLEAEGAPDLATARLLRSPGPLPQGEREKNPLRVQFWLDAHVAEAQPDLTQRIHALARKFRTRMELAGNAQIVPGGEEVKNDIHILERMLKVFHAHDLDRRSYVAVIGGGAVLDAVGFAASIAHRGLRLVRLPTTTLAQADSGIGVKNAVNAFQKKNWIGTFAVPWGVVNDATLLATLPERDFLCGFVEAVKVSLLKDAAFFEELCRQAAGFRRREPKVFLPVLRRSAQLHLQHITQGGDPFEALEARPLDFGHWSAHKLEVLSNFELRHGEAVAIGVAIDTVYSSLAVGLAPEKARQILQCLTDLGFTLNSPHLRDGATLMTGLEEFRQHLGGRLTLTMLADIGRTVDVHEVNPLLMLRAIETVAEFRTAETQRR
ncbi:MAG TPA: 3-dehydroquinate synthase [Pirellulales bacterium]|nr:3-dehydroquinate synthase [Pirellulales bacterium]